MSPPSGLTTPENAWSPRSSDDTDPKNNGTKIAPSRAWAANQDATSKSGGKSRNETLDTDTVDSIDNSAISQSSKSSRTKASRSRLLTTHSSKFVRNGSKLEYLDTETGLPADITTADGMIVNISRIFKDLRKAADWCFMLAMVGLFLNFIQREIDKANVGDDVGYDTIVTILRSLVTLSTIGMLFFLVRYYQGDFKVLQLNRVYLLESSMWPKRNAITFLIEVVACSIHEPPGVCLATVSASFYANACLLYMFSISLAVKLAF